MKPNYPKLIFAVLLTFYFLWIAKDPMQGSFLDNVDLPIHETGHLLFRILGEFIDDRGRLAFPGNISGRICGLFPLAGPALFGGYRSFLGRAEHSERVGLRRGRGGDAARIDKRVYGHRRQLSRLELFADRNRADRLGQNSFRRYKIARNFEYNSGRRVIDLLFIFPRDRRTMKVTLITGASSGIGEAFAREFGIASGSIDELRTEITANLKLELKRKIETVLKEQVMEALRAGTPIAVPRSLVEMEEKNLLQRALEDLKTRGGRPETAQLSPETFRPQAERRVQFGLILNEVVRRAERRSSFWREENR